MSTSSFCNELVSYSNDENAADDRSTSSSTPINTPQVETDTPEPESSIPFPYDQTIIIFDWDDTLLASTWLEYHNLRLPDADLTAEAVKQLENLQDSVLRLLTRATSIGTVIVITNAEKGWVELSCQKYLPQVLPIISKLKILSARSTYEVYYPRAPREWKIHAFRHELFDMIPDPTSNRNIISFGDSIHERQALLHATKELGPNTRTKSIKFVERPTIDQLKRQLDLINAHFIQIAGYDGSLDLMLTLQLLINGNE